MLSLIGCSTHMKSSEGESTAEVSLGKGGLVVKSDDGKGGTASVNIGEAHLNVDDGKGSAVKMDLSKDGQFKMKAQDHGGSFENNVPVSESDLGVPFYPGSTELSVGSMEAKSASEHVKISMRTTSASPDDVRKFYRSKLNVTDDSYSQDNDHIKAELKGRTIDGAELGITAERSGAGSTTTVTIASSRKP